MWFKQAPLVTVTVLALGAACGAPPAVDGTTSDIASSSSSSSSTAASTGAGSTDAGPTTSSTSTSGASAPDLPPDEPNPCGCPAEQICVNGSSCEPRPPGCELDEPCSPACAAVCGDDICSEPGYASPGIVYCFEPYECTCAPGELCVQGWGIDSPYLFCVVPPAGCDPADVCTAACALACSDAPPLPTNCDQAEPPGWVECVDQPFDCSLWAQNCPAGEKCIGAYDPNYGEYRAWCVPIPEPAAGVGEPCDFVDGDSCEKGAVCWGVDPDTQEKLCVPHCSGDAEQPECPPGDVCAVAADNTIVMCLPPCDPLAPACGAGTTCSPFGDQFACVWEYTDLGGKAGDPCGGLNSCDPGLLCLALDWSPGCMADYGCCAAYCDLDAPACAEPGTTCVSVYSYLDEPIPPEFAHVGVCAAAP